MPTTKDDLASIRAGQAKLDLSALDLWVLYLSVGGNLQLDEVREYLRSGSAIPSVEVLRLAVALNDEFTELGLNHPVQVGPGPRSPKRPA